MKSKQKIFSRRQLLLLLATLIAADQLVKLTARWLYGLVGDVSLPGGLVRFSLVTNDGGFLGVVSHLPPHLRFALLTIGVAVLLVACLWYLLRRQASDSPYRLPLCLVAGGGLGNLLDRLLHDGWVTDFVSIGLGPLRTGIFNLADVFILWGSFWVGFLLFRESD